MTRVNRFVVALLAVGLLFPALAAAQTLTIANGTARSGQTVALNINLAGATTVADMQFDVTFNSAQLTYVSDAKGAAASAASKDYATSPITNGIRFLISSPFSGAGASSTLAAGTVATITLRVAAGATNGQNFTVTMGGIVAADLALPNPNSVPLTAGNGTVSVVNPTAPTITAVSFSATSVTSTTPLPVRVTVTFSENIAASPAPTAVFTRTAGTGNAPTMTLSGSGTTWVGSFTPTFSNNGTFTLAFTATDANDSLALASQFTPTPTVTIGLPIPPCTNVPTATVVLNQSTFTASGTLNGTVTFGNLCPTGGAIQSGATVNISGSGSLVRTGLALTGTGNSRTFTLAVPSQAGVNGTYTIAVVAREAVSNQLATASGTLSFTIAITGLPTAVASAVALGGTVPGPVILDGRASTFGGTNVTGLTYAWTKVSGPAEGSPSIFPASAGTPGANNYKLAFNAQTAGTYQFRLTVASVGVTSAVSSTANVTFSIRDLPPIAVTRDALFARLSASADSILALDASRSFDPNGDNMTFSWASTLPVSSAVLTGNTSDVASLRILQNQTNVNGTATLTLTAGSLSSQATVRILGAATPPPRASAGLDATVVTTAAPPVTFRLFGRDSALPGAATANPAATLNFAWTQASYTTLTGGAGVASATFSSATTVDPIVTLPSEGIYTFNLTVTTKTLPALSSSAKVRVTVRRQVVATKAPRAAILVTASEGGLVTTAAGATNPVTIHTLTLQPSSSVVITLDGSTSIPGTAGSVLTYRWAPISLTGEQNITLSTTTASGTQFTVGPNDAGSVDVALQVFEGGKPGFAAVVHLVVARTNNTPPRITRAWATVSGNLVSPTTAGAEITAGGVLPTIQLRVSATDAETAAGSLSYSVIQLLQSEQTEALVRQGIDPSSPLLGNIGGTTPRLGVFASGTVAMTAGSPATFSFTPRPEAALLDSEAVGGAYVFLVMVSDPSGAEDQRIVVVPVIDRRAGGRSMLRLALANGTATEGSNGVRYDVPVTLNNNALELDMTGTVDYATGFRVCGTDGTPTTTFTGFIRWEQASGPTDFSTALAAANALNGGRGTFKLSLANAIAGNYQFRVLFDNGQSQFQMQVNAAAQAAAGTGTTGSTDDGGGLCAMSAGTMGNRLADVLVMLLPLGLVLGLRRRE